MFETPACRASFDVTVNTTCDVVTEYTWATSWLVAVDALVATTVGVAVNVSVNATVMRELASAVAVTTPCWRS